MKNPLGVSPSKGNQGSTRGKEKIFWPVRCFGWETPMIEQYSNFEYILKF